MKKVIMTIFGKDNVSLADAAYHAFRQLRMGTTSENCTWENRSHVSYDIHESSDEEFCLVTNEDPETKE